MDIKEASSVTRNPLIETTDAEAQAILARALEKEPLLTWTGIGVHSESRKRRDLLKAGNDTQTIKRQRRIATFNQKHDSYGYKHYVERWFNARGSHQYIANGSFIAAAIGLGFDGKLSSSDPESLHFQFSERTVQAPP